MDEFITGDEFFDQVRRLYPKGIDLYHHTTRHNANAILQSQRFNPDPHTGCAYFTAIRAVFRAPIPEPACDQAWVWLKIPAREFDRVWPHMYTYRYLIPNDCTEDDGMHYIYQELLVDRLLGHDFEIEVSDLKPRWIKGVIGV